MTDGEGGGWSWVSLCDVTGPWKSPLSRYVLFLQKNVVRLCGFFYCGADATLADSRTAGGGLRGLRPVGIPRGVSGEVVCQILCLNSRAFGRSEIRESRVRSG